LKLAANFGQIRSLLNVQEEEIDPTKLDRVREKAAPIFA